jgi:predicted nucleic acid-binding protein
MEPAFWDTSALVPLCLARQASPRAQQLLRRYAPVVWWSTSVEARSAFARQLRLGSLTVAEHANASASLGALKRKWQEIQPSEPLRALAEELLGRYPLSAADALQLAAAYIWSEQRPFSRCFISGDKRLLGAARSAGFQAIAID